MTQIILSIVLLTSSRDKSVNYSKCAETPDDLIYRESKSWISQYTNSSQRSIKNFRTVIKYNLIEQKTL